tara:strand:+ start:19 stop:1050 length:1032 start_codon:yes stop_codon:yes gene_type:complete
MIKHKKYSLTQRDKKVLKATIDEFITLNQPVGSKFLKEQYTFRFSSATIRNILAKLESYNLLTHIYTSSGRTPTNQGYRYYVDKFDSKLSSHFIQGYKNHFKKLKSISSNVDLLMETTATLLSEITKLFGLVMLSGIEKSVLIDIELVHISSERVLVVLALESGLIKNIVLNLKCEIKKKEIDKIAELLKEKLLGLTLNEINGSIKGRLKESDIFHHEIVQILIEHPTIKDTQGEEPVIYTSNIHELLKQPEFQEASTIRKTLEALDSEKFQSCFKSFQDDDGFTLIGDENDFNLMDHCSIVSTPFKGEQLMGQIAIVGPTRIPYHQINKTLNYLAEVMSHVC